MNHTFYAVVSTEGNTVFCIDTEPEKVAHDMMSRTGDYVKMVELQVNNIISERVVKAFARDYIRRFEREAKNT